MVQGTVGASGGGSGGGENGGGNGGAVVMLVLVAMLKQDQALGRQNSF